MTHGPEAPLLEGRDEVVKAPARGRTVVRRGFTGGHRHHLQTLCGGKSAAADPSAAHLGGHGGRLDDSDCANGQQSGDDNATRWPPGDWTDGLAPPPVGSLDSAGPKLGVSNGLGGATLNETVPRQLRSLEEQEERALSRSL